MRHKEQRYGLKIKTEHFFLFSSVLILVYVYLLDRIDFSGEEKTVYDDYNEIVASYSVSKNKKPRLDEYIVGWNVTKDVNWLLDFSIVGFPKTGTSTLMLYLKNQTQSIYIFDDERCELGWNRHVPLLQDLYRMYPGPHIKMGIKCPRDLEVDLALDNYKRFFPLTKFIVGVRHPIEWFESLYNFRVHNGFPMLPPEKLIGKCRKLNYGVCTDRANFSQHLSKIDTNRKVFLYEINQLKNNDEASSFSSSPSPSENIAKKNNERVHLFLSDLTEFLNLETPLEGPMLHIKPGLEPLSLEHENALLSMKINICHERYINLRRLLLQQALESARWIENKFLSNPNTKVSYPKHFMHLLKQWHVDPCYKKGID